MKPIFVVFEGIDRCGKGAQSKLVCQRLASKGVPSHAYWTPDRRTVVGELAGRFLRGQVGLARDPGEDRMVPTDGERRDASLALQCLLTCCRYEVAAQVRRDLVAGTSVACSRWWPSAVAYAEEDGLDTEAIRAHSLFLPEPDLFVLLDVSAEAIAARFDPGERYETSLEVQERLACRYRRLWAERSAVLPGKWVRVECAGLTEEEVAAQVWQWVLLSRRLAESELEETFRSTIVYGKTVSPGSGEKG